MELSGWYSIDGKDLWQVFSMFVESGSDTFLNYPSKKESITHDWLDSDGLDVDLSRVFFNARDLTLNVAIVADSGPAFMEKYEAFLLLMRQPGLRRIHVTELGKDYYVFYKECKDFKRFTRVQVPDDPYSKVACKFTIVFTETNPSINAQPVFIVDEQGRFLIT